METQRVGLGRDSRKVLIFIVAYNAKNHIKKVLDRLPREVFNNPDFHTLIVDDCSKDDTAKTASQHVQECKYENVTVLRNPVNQGYGGNQKIGYRYAVQNGYGLAILLHGDGQYAPELVLEFVKHWRSEKADVVLGSRMMEKERARAGGMPFYKWIGNQVLTTFQNIAVGSGLSEFHTGYRAYDTRFLSRVPFELNTNDFHFDTEILLQAFALESRCVEFSIPTHYGDEICHVNGMKYAWDVVKACMRYRFQRVGFFCSQQYRGLLKHDEGRLGSAHYHALEWINGQSTVLNLGTHSAFLENRLSALRCQVSTAKADLEREDLGGNDVSKFDYVLALDTLEKVGDAEKFLIACRYSMGSPKAPTFILSSGNVAFLPLRVLLGLGLFTYGERGILKVGYKRFFTLRTLRRTLRETGYIPGRVRGIGVPFHLMLTGRFGRVMSAISDWLARLMPSLFSYQLLIEAKPKTHTFMLLKGAERFYEPKAPAATRV